MLVGVHLDNVESPPESSYRRIRLMRADVALALWTAGTRHRRSVYEALAAVGVHRLCIRVGDERIAGSVTDYLTDVDQAVNEAILAGFTEDEIDVQILNEPNLGPGSAVVVGSFVGSVLRRWRRTARPLLPPVSRGKEGWRDYARAMVGSVGALPKNAAYAVHAYREDAENLLPVDPNGVPVVVTEFSHPDLAGRARGLWVVERLRDLSAKGYGYACQFIVDGVTGGAWPEGYRMTDAEAIEIGERGPLPDPNEPPTKEQQSVLRIVDLSNYQGIVDMSGWKAARIDGAVVRVSEDGSPLDPFAPANVAQLRDRGFLVGLYHLSDPRFATPVQSIETFQRGMDNVGGMLAGEVPFNDAEQGSPGDHAPWQAEWGRAFATTHGFKAGFYSAPWWMDPHNLSIEGVAQEYSCLWEAKYTGDPNTKPDDLPGWFEVMVQYTASGSVPGVNGNVDLNTFLGSREDWLKLGKPGVVVEPKPDPVALAIADVRSAVDRLEALVKR